MQEQLPTRRGQVLLFARNFFKHPKMLGSLVPSSRFLINRMLQPIDWERAEVIVEYGPGVGTITAELLRRMRPTAKLVVLETNNDFVRYLRGAFRDPRLQVEHRSAADVERLLGSESVDYTLSGIPFSTMPAEVGREILQATNAVLRPHGAFLVYQFSPKVYGSLTQTFGHVTREFEKLNIPPAHLFFCSPTVRGAQSR